MSENAEERWGRPIANDELKPELLPERNALWSELVFFAGTLNGYEVAGESPTELLAFADPIAQRWRHQRLRTAAQRDRLSEARRVLEHPEELAAEFSTSVRHF